MESPLCFGFSALGLDPPTNVLSLFNNVTYFVPPPSPPPKKNPNGATD